MINVTYHCGSSDLGDFSIALENCSLATDHVRAVAEHENADEGVAVPVPSNDRLVIFVGTAADTLILVMCTFDALNLGKLARNLSS